jgi:hypothetical protein
VQLTNAIYEMADSDVPEAFNLQLQSLAQLGVEPKDKRISFYKQRSVLMVEIAVVNTSEPFSSIFLNGPNATAATVLEASKTSKYEVDSYFP